MSAFGQSRSTQRGEENKVLTSVSIRRRGLLMMGGNTSVVLMIFFFSFREVRDEVGGVC